MQPLDLKATSVLLMVNFLRVKTSNRPVVEHWMDHAKEKYPTKLVDDTKCLLKLLVLYIPFPLYWALYGQQVG